MKGGRNRKIYSLDVFKSQLSYSREPPQRWDRLHSERKKPYLQGTVDEGPMGITKTGENIYCEDKYCLNIYISPSKKNVWKIFGLWYGLYFQCQEIINKNSKLEYL